MHNTDVVIVLGLLTGQRSYSFLLLNYVDNSNSLNFYRESDNLEKHNTNRKGLFVLWFSNLSYSLHTLTDWGEFLVVLLEQATNYYVKVLSAFWLFSLVVGITLRQTLTMWLYIIMNTVTGKELFFLICSKVLILFFFKFLHWQDIKGRLIFMISQDERKHFNWSVGQFNGWLRWMTWYILQGWRHNDIFVKYCLKPVLGREN